MPALSVAPLPVTAVAARLETVGADACEVVRNVRSPPLTGSVVPWVATIR